MAETYWFVGASYDRTNDQTPRFLADGIWENGYDDRYLDQVKSMRPGQRIAIKSTYSQKHNLPFDAKGQPVSVMAIKATNGPRAALAGYASRWRRKLKSGEMSYGR